MAKKCIAILLSLMCLCALFVGCAEKVGDRQIGYRNQTLTIHIDDTQKVAKLDDIVRIDVYEATWSSVGKSIESKEDKDALLCFLFQDTVTFEKKDYAMAPEDILIDISLSSGFSVLLFLNESASEMKLSINEDNYAASTAYSAGVLEFLRH